MTIGLAPLGGWVAVTGGIDLTALIFYVSVAMWTAGFDVIYACQDMDYDRKEGLHSIPVRFGIKGALWIARSLHIVTALGLISLMSMTELSWWYLTGTVIAGVLLYYEHQLVKPHDLSKLNVAFFTMNGVLSVVMFVFTFIDVAVRHL